MSIGNNIKKAAKRVEHSVAGATRRTLRTVKEKFRDKSKDPIPFKDFAKKTQANSFSGNATMKNLKKKKEVMHSYKTSKNIGKGVGY